MQFSIFHVMGTYTLNYFCTIQDKIYESSSTLVLYSSSELHPAPKITRSPVSVFQSRLFTLRDLPRQTKDLSHLLKGDLLSGHHTRSNLHVHTEGQTEGTTLLLEHWVPGMWFNLYKLEKTELGKQMESTVNSPPKLSFPSYTSTISWAILPLFPLM